MCPNILANVCISINLIFNLIYKPEMSNHKSTYNLIYNGEQLNYSG